MSLNLALATPVIWTPDNDSETWEEAVNKMLYRSKMTDAMLNEEIDFEDYLDVLNDHFIDVDACLEDWEQGKRYI